MPWTQRVLSETVLRIAAIAGAVICVASAFVDASAMLRAYLGGAIAAVAIPVGALTVLLMMDVIDGPWRPVLRPAVLTVARALPATALVFAPILIGTLFTDPWGRTPEAGWTTFRIIYMHHVFIALRGVFYFILWIIVLRGQTATQDAQAGRGAKGLLLLVPTTSLAAVDWAMSVTHTASSSIYGLLFLAHATLAGVAAALVLSGRARRPHPPMFGALLVTCILLWAYMHAMQFIIVWAGDRPDEIVWYMLRSQGVWTIVLVAIIISAFILPFLLLLLTPERSNPRAIAAISLLILAGLLLEAFWLVLPGQPGSNGIVGGTVVGSVLAAAGVLVLNLKRAARTMQVVAQ